MDLPAEHKEIKIEIFSDLHLGSKKCDQMAIKERVKRVEENENVYAIILGDVLNNSTKTSVGDVYEEGGSIFMKTEEAVIDDDKVNCVDLSCGEMFCSRDDAPVEVKHAKVVIE